jgi:hypothetical protein
VAGHGHAGMDAADRSGAAAGIDWRVATLNNCPDCSALHSCLNCSI